MHGCSTSKLFWGTGTRAVASDVKVIRLQHHVFQKLLDLADLMCSKSGLPEFGHIRDTIRQHTLGFMAGQLVHDSNNSVLPEHLYLCFHQPCNKLGSRIPSLHYCKHV